MPNPWLTIIGIGEDGLAGLSEASRKALKEAETVFGGERHLRLAQVDGRGKPWPAPFDAAGVLARRGHPTVVLASGDPFWHGAGGSLAAHLACGEWTAHPAPSTFSLAASRLGWRLEFPWARYTDWVAGPHGMRLIERRPMPPFGHFSLIRFGKDRSVAAVHNGRGRRLL